VVITEDIAEFPLINNVIPASGVMENPSVPEISDNCEGDIIPPQVIIIEEKEEVAGGPVPLFGLLQPTVVPTGPIEVKDVGKLPLSQETKSEKKEELQPSPAAIRQELPKPIVTTPPPQTPTTQLPQLPSKEIPKQHIQSLPKTPATQQQGAPSPKPQRNFEPNAQIQQPQPSLVPRETVQPVIHPQKAQPPAVTSASQPQPGPPQPKLQKPSVLKQQQSLPMDSPLPQPGVPSPSTSRVQRPGPREDVPKNTGSPNHGSPKSTEDPKQVPIKIQKPSDLKPALGAAQQRPLDGIPFASSASVMAPPSYAPSTDLEYAFFLFLYFSEKSTILGYCIFGFCFLLTLLFLVLRT
jgi:hypothetical protein